MQPHFPSLSFSFEEKKMDIFFWTRAIKKNDVKRKKKGRRKGGKKRSLKEKALVNFRLE